MAFQINGCRDDVTPLRSSAGFALPLTVFVMVILMVLTTAGLFVGRQELRIGSASHDAGLAFYVAERGLTDVIADWDAPAYGAMAVGGTTALTGTTESGTWSLDMTRLSSQLYLFESTGVLTSGGPATSSATRRLGVVARILTADLALPAALTTRDAASVRGTAEVHGEDVDPAVWGGICTGALQDKPGLLTDDTTLVTTTGAGEITGVPGLAQDTTLSDATFTEFGSVTWNDMVTRADKSLAGGSFSSVGPVLDGLGECDDGASLNWGDPESPAAPCAGYFPLIHVTGNAVMQGGGTGQGILLVDGDLSLRGGFTFYGVIIVQGSFETQGSENRIYGAVMAGNADFDNQSLTGGSVIQYSSCAVERAVKNANGLTQARPLSQRGWVDLSAIVR